MDAKNLPMQNVPGLETLTLYKYEIRQSKGEDNWIKCLIGTPELNKETGEPTGRTLAYESHGNYQGIIRWLRELERMFQNHNGRVDSWERIKECPCFDAIEEYQDI